MTKTLKGYIIKGCSLINMIHGIEIDLEDLYKSKAAYKKHMKMHNDFNKKNNIKDREEIQPLKKINITITVKEIK